MIRKECDRCGTTVDDSMGSSAGIPRLLTEVYNNIFETMCTLFGKPNYIVYDKSAKTPACLCPDCKKSFDEWMKQGALLIEQGDKENV